MMLRMDPVCAPCWVFCVPSAPRVCFSTSINLVALDPRCGWCTLLIVPRGGSLAHGIMQASHLMPDAQGGAMLMLSDAVVVEWAMVWIFAQRLAMRSACTVREVQRTYR
jgi:hypothetical protein